MSLEIERKFLVAGKFKDFAESSQRIVQGYLSSVPGRTVRVRIRGDQGFLTIKGQGSASGASRFEWEQEIPRADAEHLLALCEPGLINKTRHLVPAGRHTFEVDEFHDDNAGLLAAEIELDSEDEAFERPNWLGREVTGEARYFNSQLRQNPYCDWQQS